MILDYFAEPTLDVSELLYGSEGKIYKAEQVNPLIQRTIDRFKLVYAVHKAQCEDSYFVQRILEYII